MSYKYLRSNWQRMQCVANVRGYGSVLCSRQCNLVKTAQLNAMTDEAKVVQTAE